MHNAERATFKCVITRWLMAKPREEDVCGIFSPLAPNTIPTLPGTPRFCGFRTTYILADTNVDAEYCTLRAEAGVRIPKHVDAAKYAPILCAGMTMFNSIRHMNIPVGSTVAIQGLGGLGHLAIQYARSFGYRVVALSRNAEKEAFARELGAHEYIDVSKCDVGEQLQKLGGVSLIVSTAPTKDAIEPLLKGLGMLGKLLILSGKRMRLRAEI